MSLRDMIVMEGRGMVYLPKIEEYLLKKQNEEVARFANSKKTPAVHPSGIAHICLRNLYYQFYRMPGKLRTAKSIRTCDAGNDMHNRYHRYAKEAKILVAKEMRMRNKEYKVRARLDELVLIDERLRLIELKSMNSDKFDGLMGKPYHSFVIQANVYLWLLNKMYEAKSRTKVFREHAQHFPITEYSIVIECRNDQRIDEFTGSYDEELVNRTLHKIDDMFKFIDSKQLPPRAFESNNIECRWCDYKETCWSFDSKLKEEDMI